MEIDLSDSQACRALIKFTTSGAKAGCPFCRGRMIASVSAGQRIILLKGMYAGRFATVSDKPGWSEDEFLVRFDDEDGDTLTRISYRMDNFLCLPMTKIPTWLCHLSIDDLAAIEDACLQLALKYALAKKSTPWSDLLLPIIATVRGRRLPVLSNDVWPTLLAHGFSRKEKANFQRFFNFAILLISLNGRAPIKRKRMPPMSRGRYLSPGQQEYFGPSPQITS
jgi:hypothetical protein